MSILNRSAVWLCVALCLFLAIPLAAQVKVVKDTKTPARILEDLWVLPSGWAAKTPAHGTVNAPGQVEAIAPGQKVAVAVVAQGSGRDGLLEGRTLSIQFTSGAGTIERRDLKPVALRQIKASGADMALRLLDAGGVAKRDQATIKEATSMVTLAVFEPAWEAPSVNKEEIIRIQATISGGKPPLPVFKSIALKLRPWVDWQKDPEPDQAAFEEMLHGFHNTPQPGCLLSLLKAATRAGGLKEPPVYGFFTIAFQENAAARKAALDAFPSLDPPFQWALLFVLRLGGQDISGMMKDLPAGAKTTLEAVKPLGDPRKLRPFQDPVTPEAAAHIGVAMDECWGGWLATGDPSYLRTLVGLLDGAPDFPAFQGWMKAKGGVKGLNAAVAAGMAYQIAGWSLASFQKSDPQVADWLLFWQNDPNIPVRIREQIVSLPANAAFRREE